MYNSNVGPDEGQGVHQDGILHGHHPDVLEGVLEVARQGRHVLEGCLDVGRAGDGHHS